MHVLLTNDDGVDAPGIAALHQAVLDVGVEKVTTVAPLEPLSGCSHQATTRADIRLESRGPNRFGLAGTPADCVRVGLHLGHVDWVLSGVNFGANLGVDVYMSGTVAAAREAALLGRQAIAISQYIAANCTVDWGLVAAWTAAALRRLLERPVNSCFWNVNFPDPTAAAMPDGKSPDLRLADVDAHALPTGFHRSDDGERFRYQSDYHQRPFAAGSDVDICFGGQIAVSPVSVMAATMDVDWD